MAKNPIGEPIPVGDLPSLTRDAKAASATTDNPSSQIEDIQPEPVPADNLPALAEDMQSALPSPGIYAGSGWSDLMQMSWQLALLPALTWSSFVKASWKGWESSAQPQWPAR